MHIPAQIPLHSQFTNVKWRTDKENKTLMCLERLVTAQAAQSWYVSSNVDIENPGHCPST